MQARNYTPYIMNPAKIMLKKYRALITRRDALQKEIEDTYSKAYSRSGKASPVKVQGGNAVYDRVGEYISSAVDAKEQLEEIIRDINVRLDIILAAIESVPDETQKTILTLKYINGMKWEDIQDKIGYERTQTLQFHGRALGHVKRWMLGQGIPLESADENGRKHMV